MSRRIASEAELIQTYLAPLARRMPGALGLHDDCAMLMPPPSTDLIVTMDAVASGVHFFADDAASDIAWKALAVNVSDLAGKGAEPFAYMMALSFPDAPEHAWLSEFTSGLGQAQAAFGIGLLGGDTDKRPGPLTVTITAFGHVPKSTAVLRSGAKPGDIIFVSGTLGDSALGLKLRHNQELATRWGIADGHVAHLLNRFLRPEPRLKLGPALRDHASASMDLSDGLLKDLGRLCAASGVAAHVNPEKLPLSAATRAVVSADPDCFPALVAGGDDYELVCVVPAAHAAAFASAATAASLTVTEIGIIVAGRGEVRGIETLCANKTGWDHF